MNNNNVEFSLMREKSQKEWELRAYERNKYRTLWQKLFGQEKTTAMDIAIEEAIEMDEAIQKQLETGKAKTIKGALRNVMGYEKFQIQLKDNIRSQQYSIMARALIIGKAIEENDFRTARYPYAELRTELNKRGDENINEYIKINEILHSFLRYKVEALLDEGRVYDFASAIFFCGDYLISEDMDYIREKLKEPEIIDKIKIQAGYYFLSGYEDPNFIYIVFLAFRNFERLNILKTEEVFQLPAVRKAIEGKILENFERFYKQPEEFMNMWKNFENLDIISFQEITALAALHEAAKDKLILQLLTGDKANFSHLRDKYREIGILDKEEAAKILLFIDKANLSPLFKERKN